MEIVSGIIVLIVVGIMLGIGGVIFSSLSQDKQTLQLGLPTVVLEIRNGTIYKCDSDFSTVNQFGNMLLKCPPYSMWDRDRITTPSWATWEYWKSKNVLETKCSNPQYTNGMLHIDIGVSQSDLVQVLDWRSESDFTFKSPSVIGSDCLQIDKEIQSSYILVSLVMVVTIAGIIIAYIKFET